MTPTQSEPPIRYGMLHPARISADYDVGQDIYWLKFDGADGSQIRVGLSREEADALVRMRSNDPASLARDLYLKDHIDVDEFERRLEASSS